MIPKLGFGTWRLSGRECVEGVADALAAGYRHVDTARMYGNEGDVGEGLLASGVDRSEMFLATKVWPDDLAPDRVRASLERSLSDLGSDYVDLFLIHWPNPRIPLEATLGAMTELREQGKTREIGVSNFTAAQFREALDLAPVIVNQVEYHPFLDQSAVLKVCRERDADLTAYRPLGKGEVLDDPTIREIAAAHDATPAQVTLAWLIGQEGVSAVPKASSPERRRENLGAVRLELSADERARIDALPKDRRAVETEWSPDWD
ncbi:MAG TPA: aldo/keto reductase [Thermoleophilaceae bacterium]|nr:aldo/keto reductase [Thermoleophilaceae bacterium]